MLRIDIAVPMVIANNNASVAAAASDGNRCNR